MHKTIRLPMAIQTLPHPMLIHVHTENGLLQKLLPVQRRAYSAKPAPAETRQPKK